MPPRDKQPEQGQQTPEPDPANLTDEQLAAATEQAAVDAGTAVKLAVQYPHDVLIVGSGDNELTVTSTGTLVPAAREDEVRDAAKKNDVSLRKVT